MKYSKTTNAFYDPEIHGDAIPTDSVEITRERYLELITAQSQAMMIAPDAKGYPQAVPFPEPTVEVKKEACKRRARVLLQKTDYTQQADVREDIENISDFDLYRHEIRKLFVLPVPNPTFPDEPTPVWRVV